jgi:2-C-methyl-D-erythritol 4-phosphate cytidylyltransferase
MVTAIIVAAGRGTRMGPNVDKLFLELAGRPVVLHTWLQFDACPAIDHVVLVTRPDLKPEFEKLAGRQPLTKPFTLASGGAERQDSVWNGLEAAPEGTEMVAIQDAARPCTGGELIAATIAAARETGAAVAASPVTDTIKDSSDGRFVSRHLDRARLWAVQTPQTFRFEVIRRALQSARDKGQVFTDDTAACEAIGQPVRLVSCLTPNPKVTTPSDLPLVELYLKPGIKLWPLISD